MMYLEFKDTVFDVHFWDKQGAMTQLTGDTILRYVCTNSVRHAIERNQPVGASGPLHPRAHAVERGDAVLLLRLLPTRLRGHELLPEDPQRLQAAREARGEEERALGVLQPGRHSGAERGGRGIAERSALV